MGEVQIAAALTSAASVGMRMDSAKIEEQADNSEAPVSLTTKGTINQRSTSGKREIVEETAGRWENLGSMWVHTNTVDKVSDLKTQLPDRF